MPFLQLWWNLKETTGENTLGVVVVNSREPKEDESVLTQALRCIGITKAELRRIRSLDAALNVLDETWKRRAGPRVRGLEISVFVRDGREEWLLMFLRKFVCCRIRHTLSVLFTGH